MSSKVFAAFAILTGSTAAAVAQTCPLPSVAASVEMRSVPGSDLMTVPVAINGISKQFLLDVSTNPTEVSQALVAELKLPENNQTTDTTQFAQQIAPTGSA